MEFSCVSIILSSFPQMEGNDADDLREQKQARTQCSGKIQPSSGICSGAGTSQHSCLKARHGICTWQLLRAEKKAKRGTLIYEILHLGMME